MITLPGYKLIREIGRGGMAQVFLAVHEGLDREVAIKVMFPNLATDSSFSARFLREARIIAKLTHQNIITVYDVGVHDSHHYIAMEYLPGASLDDKIREGMEPADVFDVLKQVTIGLRFAHNKGFIHRDIKPENILFKEDGVPVITDFGIARSEESETRMTVAGTVVGTPFYMSPEQAQGNELCPGSDLYSLGIMFYEMLIGEVPYKANSSIATIFKHLNDPIPVLKGDLKIYQPLLKKMLAKDFRDRYLSADQLLVDIAKLEGQRGFAHPGKKSITGDRLRTLSDATIVSQEIQKTILTGSGMPSAQKNRGLGTKLGLVGALLVIAGLASAYFFVYLPEQEILLAQKQAELQAKQEEAKRALLLKEQEKDERFQREKSLQAEKIAELERKLEQERVAEEQRFEREKLSQELKLAEDQVLEKEAKAEEARRIAAAKAKESRLEKIRRKLEEKDLALKKEIAEKRRLAKEKKAAEEKAAALAVEKAKAAENARIAEEKLLAEKNKQAEQKLAQEKIAKEKLAQEEVVKENKLADAYVAAKANIEAKASMFEAQAPTPEATAASKPVGASMPQLLPTRSPKKRIAGFLNKGDKALENGNLAVALANYRGVQKIEPNNALAKKGLDRVAGKYLKSAEVEADKEDFRQAEYYIKRAINVAPNHPDIYPLREKIFTLKTERRQKAEGAALKEAAGSKESVELKEGAGLKAEELKVENTKAVEIEAVELEAVESDEGEIQLDPNF